MTVEFQVRKYDLPKFRMVERGDPDLSAGEVRLKIDKFAFTANNITYGVAGDSLGYWQFFPASDNFDDGWGIIPVWGFADVVESACEGINAGERLYGYFPPASSVIIAPIDINARTLTDGSAHRAKLPPLYNRYTRVMSDPGYDSKTDIARILLAPLHLTSFCLCDQLKSNDWYDAEQVVIVSASSKTSLGVAYGLAADETSPKIVGLTSARNVDFVSKTGLYDEIITYDDLGEQLGKRATVVVDMAGNGSVKSSIETQLGDDLAYYISVGVTHWENLGTVGGFDGSAATTKQENFFAPGYILERLKDWGPAQFDQRSSAFVMGAAQATFGWVQIKLNKGLAGLEEIYPSICEGSASAAIGQIIDL